MVYAIELFELPKDIPIAKLSVAATPSLSSSLILHETFLLTEALTIDINLALHLHYL